MRWGSNAQIFWDTTSHTHPEAFPADFVVPIQRDNIFPLNGKVPVVLFDFGPVGQRRSNLHRSANQILEKNGFVFEFNVVCSVVVWPNQINFLDGELGWDPSWQASLSRVPL